MDELNRNPKQWFDFQVQHGLRQRDQELDLVCSHANKLLEWLYMPVTENHLCTTDKARLAMFDIDDTEPVNWGALSATVIKQPDGSFEITLDEAQADECPTLCSYVYKYLTAWGWQVTVISEW